MSVIRNIALLLVCLLLLSIPVAGEESDLKKHFLGNQKGGEKTILFADEFFRDDKTEIITARGNVEMTREGKTVYADLITYNQKIEFVTAIGHVRLHDEKGDITFASYAELTGGLKEAFAKEVRGILSDNSLFAANEAHRIDDCKNQLDQMIYSPCKLCKKDPLKAPLWQIKSRHTVLDEETDDVTHADASFEFYGVPILYTPYLRHPGPNVKRRSGILAPLYGGSKDLGAIVGVPYFWVLDEDKDLTIIPVYTKVNPLLIVKYRQRLCHGNFQIESSITQRGNPTKNEKQAIRRAEEAQKRNPKKKVPSRNKHDLRGHISTQGDFDLNKNWRAGFDIERTLDDTYFRRYKILGHVNDPFLTSRIYAERFTERNYADVEGLSYQAFRLGDRARETPIIAPGASIHLIEKSNQFGGNYYFDGYFLNLFKTTGFKDQRLNLIGRWERDTVYENGSVLDLGVALHQDLYHIENFNLSSPTELTPNSGKTSGTKYSGNQGRFFPQLYSTVRYPFIKLMQEAKLILEPLVGVILGPAHIDKKKIPDEDSSIFEFNDLNLFSPLRVAGLDRIDPGSRVNWGLHAVHSLWSVNTDLFVGQSYMFSKPARMYQIRGLNGHLSDYVARGALSYEDYLTLEGRFMFDHKDWSATRNESSIKVGPPIFRLMSKYSRLPKVATPNLAYQQVKCGVSSEFTESWTVGAHFIRGLGNKRKQLSMSDKGRKLEQGVTLSYEDECFTFESSVTKTYYTDRDVRPGTTVLFTLVFKNLGSLSFSPNLLGLTDSRRKPPADF